MQRLLTSSSYWGLKDIKTDQMVIDFDTSYTKISADSGSNFFYSPYEWVRA